MDFTTTEAADDLGGLVRTITESVCTPEHQRELDGARRTLRQRPVGQAHRRRHPVHRRAGIVGRRRFRRAGAVGGARSHWAGSWPRCPTWSRSCSPRARWRSSAPRSCSRQWAVPAVNGEKILTVALDGDMGEGPVQATGERRRLPAHRHPHPGRLRTGRRRVPGARRNRFGHQGFRGRHGRPGRHGHARWTPPGTAASGISSCTASSSATDRVVGGAEVGRLADRHMARWAAAHFSSACWSARWS